VEHTTLASQNVDKTKDSSTCENTTNDDGSQSSIAHVDIAATVLAINIATSRGAGRIGDGLSLAKSTSFSKGLRIGVEDLRKIG